MLSKQVKQRIAKNKRRRIQCRTKNGRDLFRLVRSVGQRTTRYAVDYLLNYGSRYNGLLEKLKSSGRVLGISQFIKEPDPNAIIPTGFRGLEQMANGGFKRGDLSIYGAFVRPSEAKSDMMGNLYRRMAAEAMRTGKQVMVRMPYRPDTPGDIDMLIGLDPGDQHTDVTVVKILKSRCPDGEVHFFTDDISSYKLETLFGDQSAQQTNETPHQDEQAAPGRQGLQTPEQPEQL